MGMHVQLILPAKAAVGDSSYQAGVAAAADLPVSVLQPASMLAIRIRMLSFFCLVISGKILHSGCLWEWKKACCSELQWENTLAC